MRVRVRGRVRGRVGLGFRGRVLGLGVRLG